MNIKPHNVSNGTHKSECTTWKKWLFIQWMFVRFCWLVRILWAFCFNVLIWASVFVLIFTFNAWARCKWYSSYESNLIKCLWCFSECTSFECTYYSITSSILHFLLFSMHFSSSPNLSYSVRSWSLGVCSASTSRVCNVHRVYFIANVKTIK